MIVWFKTQLNMIRCTRPYVWVEHRIMRFRDKTDNA